MTFRCLLAESLAEGRDLASQLGELGLEAIEPVARRRQYRLLDRGRAGIVRGGGGRVLARRRQCIGRQRRWIVSPAQEVFVALLLLPRPARQAGHLLALDQA